jgi:hypothetical protein
MRATDIVRKVLDVLDACEEDTGAPKVDVQVNQNDDDDGRFKQILAMLDATSFGPLANSPNEVVAPIEAVTTDAGGGINGPKHPHDIRIKDPSMYPDQQEY